MNITVTNLKDLGAAYNKLHKKRLLIRKKLNPILSVSASNAEGK